MPIFAQNRMKFEKRRLIRYFFELISENRLVVLLPRIWTTFEVHQTWCVVNLFWEIGSGIAPTQPEVLVCCILYAKKLFSSFSQISWKSLRNTVLGVIGNRPNTCTSKWKVLKIGVFKNRRFWVSGKTFGKAKNFRYFLKMTRPKVFEPYCRSRSDCGDTTNPNER